MFCLKLDRSVWVKRIIYPNICLDKIIRIEKFVRNGEKRGGAFIVNSRVIKEKESWLLCMSRPWKSWKDTHTSPQNALSENLLRYHYYALGSVH